MDPAQLTIRALDRDDGQAVDAVFAGLSPLGRAMRLGPGRPGLPPDQRARLLGGDGCDRLALLAEVADGGRSRPVGIAELIRTGPDRAELAVEVVGDCLRRGIGTRLLSALAEAAAGVGYTELEAEVLAVNAPAVALLRSVFPATTTTRYGSELVVHCPLAGATAARPAGAPALVA